jgi:hypothetical protein
LIKRVLSRTLARSTREPDREKPCHLFDLLADIAETNNLIDKHPHTATQLEELVEIMRSDEGYRTRLYR